MCSLAQSASAVTKRYLTERERKHQDAERVCPGAVRLLYLTWAHTHPGAPDLSHFPLALHEKGSAATCHVHKAPFLKSGMQVMCSVLISLWLAQIRHRDDVLTREKALGRASKLLMVFDTRDSGNHWMQDSDFFDKSGKTTKSTNTERGGTRARGHCWKCAYSEGNNLTSSSRSPTIPD